MDFSKLTDAQQDQFLDWYEQRQYDLFEAQMNEEPEDTPMFDEYLGG